MGTYIGTNFACFLSWAPILNWTDLYAHYIGTRCACVELTMAVWTTAAALVVGQSFPEWAL